MNLLLFACYFARQIFFMIQWEPCLIRGFLDVLQSCANGLQPAPAGADTTAYYRLLCQQAEKLNQAQEKRVIS